MKLTKVFLEHLWIIAMKKDPTFRNVMLKPAKIPKTQKNMTGLNRQKLPSIRENSYFIDCFSNKLFPNTEPNVLAFLEETTETSNEALNMTICYHVTFS